MDMSYIKVTKKKDKRTIGAPILEDQMNSPDQKRNRMK
jgi:hypothetical protein